MTEMDKDARLRTARWVLVGVFGVFVALIGTVAFGAAALPEQGATYSDLPVVRVAATSMTTSTSPAPSIGATAAETSVSPLPPKPGPAPARTATTKSSPTGSGSKTTASGASTSSNGNTTEKKVTEKKREVVAPQVRVEESDGHRTEGSSGH